MKRIRYPKLPMAVLLGSIGWLLILYPQSLNLYALIVSGQRILLQVITGGSITSSEKFWLSMLGVVIGPLAAALALLAMFSEVWGHWDHRARRAASCIAAVLLLTSAAAVLWQDSLINQGIPPAGTSVAARRAGAVLNSVFLCSWALLFGVFAGTTSPFRSRFTRAIAGLIAIEAALFVVLLLYFVHWRFSHLLATTITVSPYALMLVFLLVARRESATPANAD